MPEDADKSRDHQHWYDRVAERDGGYVRTWKSTRTGACGEDAFEAQLLSLLGPTKRVLDAGCGSGEFTLRAAARAHHVTGFDFAAGMIEAARNNQARSGVPNASFIHAASRELPFEAASFELIYSRRGPTSILLHPELLTPGGWMIGVHSAREELIRERLASSGLENRQLREYRAVEVFPTQDDFARYWSRMPGRPDYLDAEHAETLAALAREHFHDGELRVDEVRYVWRGQRPQ